MKQTKQSLKMMRRVMMRVGLGTAFFVVLLGMASPVWSAGGNPVAWGDNFAGELGDGNSISGQSNVPVAVTTSGVLAGKTVTAMAGGNEFSLALAGGQVYAWGSNSDGQLGNRDPNFFNQELPVVVNTTGTPMAGKTITAIAAGKSHSLALASDGTAYAWGSNLFGKLGNNSTADSDRPVAVILPSGVTFKKIAAGQIFNLALGSDGKVYAWGANSEGQLGNGTSIGGPDSKTPTAVVTTGTPIEGKTITAIAAGQRHCLALDSNGAVYAWGLNDSGQLGNGTGGDGTNNFDSGKPVAVALPSGVTFTKIAAGSNHSLAIGSDNKLYAWGGNERGQLGDGSACAPGPCGRNFPGLVATDIWSDLMGKTVTAVAAGTEFSVALGADGRVCTWGASDVGQTGQGRSCSAITEQCGFEDKYPGAVRTRDLLAGQTVTTISAGYTHSLALATGPTACTPAPAGLVHWWPGEGDANDIVGTAHGTLNGSTLPTFQPGIVRRAFDFNGAGTVDLPSMNVGTTFTVEFWMFPNRVELISSDDYQQVVANDHFATNAYGGLFLVGARYRRQMQYIQGNVVRASSDIGSVVRRQWSHVALTYDGTRARLFINGVAASDNESNAPYADNFNNPLRLAFAIANGNNFFPGLLDEVAIYNRALSATEIQAIVNAGNKGKCIPCPTITLTPNSLPNGTIGAAYNQAITATSGSGSYAFTKTVGTLPTGLTLAANGVLSDTPTAKGTFNFTVKATDANDCTGTKAYSVIISCPTITLSPSTLPDGALGTAYSQTVSASGGAAPYTFAKSVGTLPTGLSLNATTGVLSGTPSAKGVFNFTLRATDANGCTGSKAYSVRICPVITLAPTTLPDGKVGTSYSKTMSASGGSAPYTFSKSSGTLPNGLTLNSTTGVLSGTPTAAGNFNFTVRATDANGCSGTRIYAIDICPIITLAPSTLPDGVINVAYSQNITASGGTAPYTFTVSSGTLPNGLTLSTNGVLSGTPGTLGNFSFVVKATAANGCSGARAYTISVCPAITLSPATLPNGTFGTAYSKTITASGGTAPYSFTKVGTLPGGLTLSRNGTLSGTPSAIGTFDFSIRATDANGCSGTRAYTVIINCPVITLAPNALPDGKVGNAYSKTFTASGGTAPYTFSKASGTLPTGLSLNATTGVLSGTPTTAGTFNFTIRGTDINGCFGTRAYAIDVCPLIRLTPGLLADGRVGFAYSKTIAASGGIAPYGFAVTTGTLPPGLTLSSTGTLSGTPTTVGSYNFTVKATDANGCSGSRAYSLQICPIISIAPTNLPGGAVGTFYNTTITASGGTGPYSFRKVAGTLPNGLTLNATTGVLSGTPTVSGSFTFTVRATDANGCLGQRNYTIDICPLISLSPISLPDGRVNTAYSKTITAAGGTAPYSFSVSVGALPPGLTLSSTGTLSGTPTTAGSYNFTVSAGDTDSCSGTHSYSIVICNVIFVSPNSLPPGTIGATYNQVIAASNGTAPYSFSVAVGALPTGLTLDATSGVLSGTPTAAGNFNFTIKATDDNGCSGSRAYNIVLSQFAAAAWGRGAEGQLGNAGSGSSVPVAVNMSGVLAGKSLTKVSAGFIHSLALASDKRVYSWGYNGTGALGTGIGNNTSTSVPVAVDTSGVLAGKDIIAIAAGVSHSLAVASDGSVYAWGDNPSGQLGNSTSGPGTQTSAPVAVIMNGALAGKTVVAVAGGARHSLALTSDGKVYTWGSNEYGQLGNGTGGDSTPNFNSSVPVAVVTSGVLSGKTITAIAAGAFYNLVLTSEGKVYSWGIVGQLGNGSGFGSNVPVAVDTSGVLAGKTVTAIAAGCDSSHSLVLTSEGKVYSWGMNNAGQLGNGSGGTGSSFFDSNVPVAVDMTGVLAGKTVTQIETGRLHSIVLTADGKLYSWGQNDAGQLGTTNIATPNAVGGTNFPVAVDMSGLLAGKTVTSITAGGDHNLVIY